MENITRLVAKNTIFQLAGRAVNLLLSLFLVGFLTRYLGTEGFGEYSTIFAYLAIAAAVADFGFITYLTRETAKNPDSLK